mgnify:CR=1 FL=1|tara:strand:+ start:10818 stop:11234 length:417 start_codon:yes stop_codon:yes gene_type:complete
MNTLIFERLIQTYGLNKNKWPLEQKEQMLQYARSHTNCLTKFHADSKLDSLLDHDKVKPPSKALSKSILEKTCYRSTLDFKSLFCPIVPKFSALSAALLLGLSLGVYQHSGNHQNDFEFNAFIDTIPHNTKTENEIIL